MENADAMLDAVDKRNEEENEKAYKMLSEGKQVKVTVDLQGCPRKNHSYARRLYYNHRKVYIIVKLIKCRIRRNNFFSCNSDSCTSDALCNDFVNRRIVEI